MKRFLMFPYVLKVKRDFVTLTEIADVFRNYIFVSIGKMNQSAQQQGVRGVILPAVVQPKSHVLVKRLKETCVSPRAVFGMTPHVNVLYQVLNAVQLTLYLAPQMAELGIIQPVLVRDNVH